jgi:hypothetical protein
MFLQDIIEMRGVILSLFFDIIVISRDHLKSSRDDDDDTCDSSTKTEDVMVGG